MGACTGDAVVPGDFDLEVTVDENMVTLVDVSWTTQEPAISWVEYGTTPDLGMTTPTTLVESTEHGFTLYGLTALADVSLVAYADTGDDLLQASAEITLPNRPSNLPDPQVTLFDQSAVDTEQFIMGSILGETNALFAINREGEWVWYAEADSEFWTMDLQLSLDGHGIIYNGFSSDDSIGYGLITRRSINGELLWQDQTNGAHHAFAQLPDGVLAFIVSDTREWYNEDADEKQWVVGDCIILWGGADEEPFPLFSTWNWAEPYVHDDWDVEFYEDYHDWTHGNSLKYYDQRDVLALSLANIDTVLEISRATGEVTRAFGEDQEYTFDRGTEPMDFQHDAQITIDNTLLVTTRLGGLHIIGAEYSIDEETKTLSKIWSHGEDEGLEAITQGQVIKLGDGNVLVNFGSAGVMQEVSPEGEVVWEIQADVGNWFGNVVMFSDFYAFQ